MSVTIFHNPRCSKSRETLKLIEARGFKPKIVEYLRTRHRPPSSNPFSRSSASSPKTPASSPANGSAAASC